MRATGIVRRIDDLGRVVIPKEIRRTLRIREGDPVEIFLDSSGAAPMVCFQKYTPLQLDDDTVRAVSAAMKCNRKIFAIFNNDTVVVDWFSRRGGGHLPTVTELEEVHNQTRYDEYEGVAISPIKTDDTVWGWVVVKKSENDQNPAFAAEFAAKVLANQFET